MTTKDGLVLKVLQNKPSDEDVLGAYYYEGDVILAMKEYAQILLEEYKDRVIQALVDSQELLIDRLTSKISKLI
jgi:hypothetical protein